MERKPPDTNRDEAVERVRLIGERAELAGKRAAFHLHRAAAALRAPGYGYARRRRP